MAFDINSVTLVGRLTRDGEFSYTQNTNKPLYRFSIANNTGRSDAQDSVHYFDVVVWDKIAEICNQYLSKGSQVIVMGRLTQRRYQDQQGQQRSRIEIVANTVQFLGGSGAGSGGGMERSSSSQSSSNETGHSGNKVSFDGDDDIPF